MSLSLLLLLPLACNTQTFTDLFMGTVMTYTPKSTNMDGSVVVHLRYKQNFQLCSNLPWQCLTGDCGSDSTEANTVMADFTEGWCLTEMVSTRQVPSNAPFQLSFKGGDWISNGNGIVSSKAVTLVELRTRSDTGRANTSPQTTILPYLRNPSNCGREYSLFSFDPDGDDVKCRPGSASLSECDMCTLPFGLFSNCTFSLIPKAIVEGSQAYVIQLVMEDFPRQNITMTQTNGSQTTITTNAAISKIPVQFVFWMDPAAPSCIEGLYLPIFLPPTPMHGAKFYANVEQTLQIDIQAEANVSTISDLLVSGPFNVLKSSSGPGQFTLQWTPSQTEAGESFPICFVVKALFNSNPYQSELRCVAVTVGNITTTPPDTVNASTISSTSPGPTPTPPPASQTTPSTPSATYVVGLSAKVSSSRPLSSIDVPSVLQQIKDRLVSLGLPQDVTLRIVNAVQQQPTTATPLVT